MYSKAIKLKYCSDFSSKVASKILLNFPLQHGKIDINWWWILLLTDWIFCCFLISVKFCVFFKAYPHWLLSIFHFNNSKAFYIIQIQIHSKNKPMFVWKCVCSCASYMVNDVWTGKFSATSTYICFLKDIIYTVT